MKNVNIFYTHLVHCIYFKYSDFLSSSNPYFKKSSNPGINTALLLSFLGHFSLLLHYNISKVNKKLYQ